LSRSPEAIRCCCAGRTAQELARVLGRAIGALTRTRRARRDARVVLCAENAGHLVVPNAARGNRAAWRA
jgi:hypothetical protein